MDTERFKEIFKEEYDWKTERINDGVVQGILLMRKYVPSAGIEGADHDVIYSIGTDKLCKAGITEEDARILNRMGWHVDNEYLRKYV